MKILGPNRQTILLTLIDQEAIAKLNNKQVFVPEIIKDDASLDFTQILQRQWSLEPEQIIFNDKNNSDLQQSKDINDKGDNFFNEATHGGMVVARDKRKEVIQKLKLPQIQTAFNFSKEQWDVDEFLQATWFQVCTRFFVLVYVIGLLLTDYSFRLQQQSSNSSKQHQKPLSSQNIVSLNFQLFANCAFTLEILLKMFSKNRFMTNPWNVTAFIGCLSCWISLSVDFEVNDGNPLYHLMSILKILLGARIIEIFDFIKNPFESFILTIPELSKIFFPYIVFIIMYSVLGLILFYDANQHKCRSTQFPVNNIWPEVSTNLCGSQMFTCKAGYCGNPYDHGLSYNQTQKHELGNQYGLVSFENIGSSFLVVYHYVFLSNWTSIMYKFSKFMNPYLTTFYFFTLALFLFFIMANLNMITMCKSFIEKQKEKERFVRQQKPLKKKAKDQSQQQPQHILKILKVLDYTELILIVSSAIVILIEYEGITRQIRSHINKTDFALTIICLTVTILKTIILRKQVCQEKLMILDWVCLMMCVGDFVHCLVIGQNMTDPSNNTSRIMRGVKLVRIIKIIYFSESAFTFEKTILKMFVKTLNTVKSFLLLLLCVTVILAMIGQNLFANLVRFDHFTNLPDLEHGTSYFINFDSLYKSIIAIILLLENQRWTETMYNFYNVIGWEGVAFFTLVVFIIHLLLTRLFLAVFLCYFRRNLEKPGEIEQHTEKQKQPMNKSNSSNQDQPAVEFQQKKSEETIRNDEKELNEEEQKLFWVFKRNMCFFQFLRACYNSLIFHRALMAVIVVHCLTIILRTSNDSPQKILILNIIEYFPLYFYVLELLIGILGNGLYWNPKSYLKESIMNYVNVIVVVLVIVSELKFLGEFETSIIRRLTILKILSFFTRTNKETSIVLAAISSISERFVRMIIIYMFLLIISSLLPLKLANDRLSACYNYGQAHKVPHDFRQCMLMGGDWVRDPQQFSNIFQSVVLMYQVVTAESWVAFVEKINKGNQIWDLFFVLNFFVYNLCLLNIFVGLTVETYLSLKDEAYKLNLLQPNQRMWLLIRNSINELIPVPMMKEPKTESKFRKIAYYIISQPIYENFIDLLPYLNILIYSLNYYRAPTSYIIYLQYTNNAILAIFMIDTVLKLQLHRNYFYLENSKIEFIGFVYHVFYIIFMMATSHKGHEVSRAFKFVGALLLILRCKKLLFRFTWSKTLLNSVIDVLPKCLIIGALLAAILFFYISIGMEIFKNTKPTSKSDGYITGFNNAFTSLMTLLKIVSNQSWFQQVGAFVRDSSPIDICFPIHTMDDLRLHSSMGCGSRAGYVYFISFHMIIALLVMNLLIATMVAAYDENYEKQYKSVNIFQLQDCLKLWQKYDKDATGLIPYKQFWRLSSQIAILFGISKKKLIKGKQKFLEELDVEVCQSIEPKSSKVLCYKFHDVLTKLSKIKLAVSKGFSEENSDHLDFEIHPMIQQEIKDYVKKPPPLYENMKSFKNLKSGEMKYFFGLLRKMRAWRIVAKKKDSGIISKLSSIINMALDRRTKEEAEIARIRNSITHLLENF